MAITFHQAIASWAGTSGSSGKASSSFTPNAAGDTLLIFGADIDNGGETLTYSSSVATTYATPVLTAASFSPSSINQVWVQGATQVSDLYGQTVTPGFSLACAAGAQTASVKSSATTDGVVGVLLDYSGVGAVNVGLAQANSPAALAGPTIGVPTGYVLVALCWCASSANAITASNGTSRATGTMNGGAYCISEFAGSGVVTPAWSQTGSDTQVFDITYWFLTPAGGVSPIYIVQSVLASETTDGTWACTLPNETTVGNIIWASLAGGNSTSVATPFPLSQFNDNVNGGGALAYTQVNPTFQSSIWQFGVHGYRPVTVAGSTTVTAASTTGPQTAFISAVEIGGFGSNTPTIDAGASVSTFGTSATQGGDVSSAFNCEILFCAPWNEDRIEDAVSGWNAFGADAATYDNNYYAPLSAAQADNFSGTLASSVAWLSVFGGIYSAAPSGGALSSLGSSASSGEISLAGAGALTSLGGSRTSGVATLGGAISATTLGASQSAARAQAAGTGAASAPGASRTSGIAQPEGAGSIYALATSATLGRASLGGAAAVSTFAASDTSGLAQAAGAGAITALAATSSRGVAAISGPNPGSFGFMGVSLTANAEQPATPITQYTNAPGVSVSAATVQARGVGPLSMLAGASSAALAQLAASGVLSALATGMSRASVTLTGSGAIAAAGASSSAAIAQPAGGAPISAQGTAASSGTANGVGLGAGSMSARGASASSGQSQAAGAGSLSMLGTSVSAAMNMLGGAMPLSMRGVSMSVGPGQLSATFALSALGVSGTEGRSALTGAGAITAHAASATAGLTQPQGAAQIGAFAVSMTSATVPLAIASNLLTACGVSLSVAFAMPQNLLFPDPRYVVSIRPRSFTVSISTVQSWNSSPQ